MSSQATGVGTSTDGDFGANEWLVAEMYDQFAKDRDSVDRSWWPVLEAYEKTQQDASAAAPAEAKPAQANTATAAPAKPAEPSQAKPAASTSTADARPLTAPIPLSLIHI